MASESNEYSFVLGENLRLIYLKRYESWLSYDEKNKVLYCKLYRAHKYVNSLSNGRTFLKDSYLQDHLKGSDHNKARDLAGIKDEGRGNKSTLINIEGYFNLRVDLRMTMYATFQKCLFPSKRRHSLMEM